MEDVGEVSLDFGRGKSKHRPRNDESCMEGTYLLYKLGIFGAHHISFLNLAKPTVSLV